jgi:hypothetical protein
MQAAGCAVRQCRRGAGGAGGAGDDAEARRVAVLKLLLAFIASQQQGRERLQSLLLTAAGTADVPVCVSASIMEALQPLLQPGHEASLSLLSAVAPAAARHSSFEHLEGLWQLWTAGWPESTHLPHLLSACVTPGLLSSKVHQQSLIALLICIHCG